MLEKGFEAHVRETAGEKVSHYMEPSVFSGMSALALTGMTANAGMSAKPVPSKVSWVSSTNPQPMTGKVSGQNHLGS